MAGSAGQAPTWFEVLGVLTPLATAALTAYLGFRFGRANSEHNLQVEKERLNFQRSIESQKALREERASKIGTWRREVSRHTGLHVDTKAPVFRKEAFVQTEAYLNLRGYLTEEERYEIEGGKPNVDARSILLNLDLRQNPPQARDLLLHRIDELEKEWGLI